MTSITEISDGLGDWPTGDDEPVPPPPITPADQKEKVIIDPPRPEDDSANNSDQWIFKKVQLIDGDFNYWEAKAGNAIFVDTKNLENVNLLTPAVAQKLFPS